MIEVDSSVLVKSREGFNRAKVLEIAKNNSGKYIYKVTYREDNDGLWIDGSKVFETDGQSKAEITSEDVPGASDGSILPKRIQ